MISPVADKQVRGRSELRERVCVCMYVPGDARPCQCVCVLWWHRQCHYQNLELEMCKCRGCKYWLCMYIHTYILLRRPYLLVMSAHEDSGMC